MPSTAVSRAFFGFRPTGTPILRGVWSPGCAPLCTPTPGRSRPRYPSPLTSGPERRTRGAPVGIAGRDFPLAGPSYTCHASVVRRPALERRTATPLAPPVVPGVRRHPPLRPVVAERADRQLAAAPGQPVVVEAAGDPAAEEAHPPARPGEVGVLDPLRAGWPVQALAVPRRRTQRTLPADHGFSSPRNDVRCSSTVPISKTMYGSCPGW